MQITTNDILQETVYEDGCAYSVLIKLQNHWYCAQYINGKYTAHTHRKVPFNQKIKNSLISFARERVAKLPKSWHDSHNKLYCLN